MSSSEPRTTNDAPRKKKLVEKIRIFLEMIKFEHSLFALPFAYLGMVLAGRGWPSWEKFLWITLAMVSFRTMAMAANRLVDQPIDALNPRTASRALPAGLLKTQFVWQVVGFTTVIFLWACFQLNELCLKLALIPYALAWIYPYLKRWTLACHFLLGIVLGIAPYGAWIAVLPEFSWTPGYLMLGVLCWVTGFDIIYALLDLDFDRQKGLHSVPAKLGDKKARVLAQGLHGLTLIFWIAAGASANLSWIYFVGLLVAAILMMREHFLVARSNDVKNINDAFFKLNAWVSFVVFLSAVLGIK